MKRGARYKLFGDLAYVTGNVILPGAGRGIGSMSHQTAPSDEELVRTMLALLKDIDSPHTRQSALELVGSHPRLKQPEDYAPAPFQEEWL